MNEPAPVVRVMLVDDQPLLREGIATILSAQPGLEVVAQAATGDEAIELAARTEVEVICMDVEMPGIDGLEAKRQIIVGSDSTTRVLVLTTFSREGYLLVAMQFRA